MIHVLDERAKVIKNNSLEMFMKLSLKKVMGNDCFWVALGCQHGRFLGFFCLFQALGFARWYLINFNIF